MLLGWIELIGGLLILLVGGEFLVRAAVKLAVHLKISAAVIGLTIVSFGTSFPELVVSVNAALAGHPDISIGNVVGSNIANLALVLGITAMIFPMVVERSNLVLDWPFMLICSVLLIVFGYDLELARWEGLVLIMLLGVYNFWVIRNSRKNFKPDENDNANSDTAGVLRSLLLLVVSVAGLIFGADILVDGAVVIARSFQVEERVIALTIIAFGTSAPELATSLVAVYRKEDGLSIGNLIGSNIFNILGILGVTSILTPIPMNPSIVNVDFWWFIAIPLLIYPLFLTKLKVTRIEAALLLGSYLTYVWLLF
ncbi:MAG: calcium/sodium antiporter [Flavobacteriales bacterium]